MKVKDCMCNDVCCVKPETNLKEVAKIMSQNHIQGLDRTGDKDVTEVPHNYFEGNQGVWGTFCAFLRRLRLFNA